MRVPFVCPPAAVTWAPNLAMATLGAATLAAGHEFVGFDVNIAVHNQIRSSHRILWHDSRTPFWMTLSEVEGFWRSHAAIFEAEASSILDASQGLVAMHASITTTNAALLLAREIKRLSPATYVVMGGPDCFRGEPGFTLLDDPAVDAICTGEAETVWGDFLDSFSDVGAAVDVPGFCYRSPGGYRRDRGDPPPVAQLDELSFADYSAVDLQNYTQNNRLFMMTSRGCILRCAFCSEGTAYRYRSPENLVSEVERHVTMVRRKSGRPPHIHFSDSLINGRPDLLERFCDLVLERGVEFEWGGMALLRKEMTESLLRKMRRAGCSDLAWGLESGSSETLRLMNKKLFVPELAERIIQSAHMLGFRQYTNIIVGFPGETEEQFEETLRFAERVKGYFSYVGAPMMELRPNTAVAREPSKYGVVDTAARFDWRNADGSNTPAIRSRRRARLMAVLGAKYVDYGWNELYAKLGIDGEDGILAKYSQDQVTATEQLIALVVDKATTEELPRGMIQGGIEGIEDGRVFGWVRIPAMPQLRVPITVRVGDKVVFRGNADQFRADLSDAEIGDALYGFDVGLGSPQAVGWPKEQLTVSLGESGCRLAAINRDVWLGYADPAAMKLVEQAASAPPEAAEVLLAEALALDPDALPAHQALAILRRPGPDYLDHLATLHGVLRPRLYIEIGVGPGMSLRLAGPETKVLAIDPMPRLSFVPGSHVRLFREPSDMFFGRADLTELVGEEGFGLAFIDGGHSCLQVLRDYLNLERFAAPGAVIAIHDTVPLDAATASPERRTTFWSGDAWKAVEAIRKLRPEASITTIAAAPTGLTLVQPTLPAAPLAESRLAEVAEELSASDWPAAADESAIRSVTGLIEERFGLPPIEIIAPCHDRDAWRSLAERTPALFQPRQCEAAVHRVLRQGVRISGATTLVQATLANPNIREGLLARGLNSRQRAFLLLLDQILPKATERRILVEGDAILRDVVGTSDVEAEYDAILNCEQLNLVADPDALLRRSRKMLRSGGTLLASLHFAPNSAADLVMSCGVPGLLPPADTSDGNLLMGWNVLRRCRRTGFRRAVMVFLASEMYGLLDTNLPGLFLLEAEA